MSNESARVEFGAPSHRITACYQNLREYESSMQTSVTREPLCEMLQLGGGRALFDPSLSSGYFVRQATEEDIPFLVRMRLMLQHHMESVNPHILRHNEAWRNRLPNMYREQIGNPNTLVLITINEDNGQAAGMAVGQLIEDPYMEVKRFVKINDVWIGEGFRRKGICSALLKVIMEYYKERSISTFTLNYVINNLDAESAWHAIGFKPIIRNCLLTIG